MRAQIKYSIICFFLFMLTSTTFGQTQKVLRHRTCTLCNQSKPVSEFSGDLKTCKACLKKTREIAEKKRIDREQAEKEHIAREKAEKDSIAREQAEKERIAREKAEKDSIAREQAEKEFIAQTNDSGADFYLGRNGKKKNYPEAIKCYQETAMLGDITGKINLACSYFQQDHSPWVDHPEAYHEAWAETYRLAKNGNAIAQNNYAIYLKETTRYARDKKLFKNVLEWLLKAAYKNDVYAMYNIGRHLESYSLAKDVITKEPLFNKKVTQREAREWYLKAATMGFRPAQARLSKMLEYGWGGKKNKKQARYWREKAESQGMDYISKNPFHLSY